MDCLLNLLAVISESLWLLPRPRPRRSSLFENMTFSRLEHQGGKSWQTQAGVPNHWEFPREMFMCIQFIFCMHKCIQMIINAIKCLIIVNDMQKMQKYLNLCSGHLMIEAQWLSARTTELPFGAKPYLCGSQEMDVTSARRGKCSCTKTGMEIDG